MKVGVIGCGYIANTHLSILTTHFLVSSISISDIDKIKMNEAGAKFGIPLERQFINYKDMLESDIDIAFVLTPTVTHAKLVIDALEYRKHVFVEKPLSITTQEAKKIVKKVKETGLNVGVGYNLRYMPQMQMAKRLLKRGAIGSPIFVSGSYLSDDIYTRELPPKSFYLSQKKGGGILLDSMCHIVDIAMWIIDRKIQEVTSMSATFDKLPVENTVSMLLKFQGELIGCLRGMWAPLGEFLHTRNLKVLEVIGTGGYICSELYGGSVKIYRKGKGLRTLLPRNADPNNPFWCLKKSYRDQLTAFLNAIRRKRISPIDAEYGAYIVSIIEKARIECQRFG